MPHFFKTPISFTAGFRHTSRHVSATSNHCRKLSTTQIQQRNRVRIPITDHCSSLSELNQKWTERLQKHDAVWSERLQELDAMWSKRLQEADSLRLKSTVELEAMRFERSQKQWEENQHLSLKIHDLRDRITTEEESMEQLKQILKIRGAMRNVVDRAKLAEMISPTAGTQEGLDELAKREEFTIILKDEVEARGLTVQRVMASFHRLDSLVAKPLFFDTRSAVVVPYADLTNEERAALVILFKVQEKWPKSFWFREEKSGENDDAPDYEYNYDSD
ncbi:hypothetical protein B9Z19DRAFT_1134980 [Tuber borchii]|uniref:Uncharacterized protein n=1 Tax=Tuber borchii TaxID=42251 RepID=A0A2T6ZDI9_TUBBO|nr:hypothetical protein B9Z19DRAFT_1134980 [Tuber borchii]